MIKAVKAVRLTSSSHETCIDMQTYNALVGQVWSWWSFSSTTKDMDVLDVSGFTHLRQIVVPHCVILKLRLVGQSLQMLSSANRVSDLMHLNVTLSRAHFTPDPFVSRQGRRPHSVLVSSLA